MSKKKNEPQYVIWSVEHNMYWRENRMGYSTLMEEAGLYTYDEAVRICENANITRVNEIYILHPQFLTDTSDYEDFVPNMLEINVSDLSPGDYFYFAFEGTKFCPYLCQAVALEGEAWDALNNGRFAAEANLWWIATHTGVGVPKGAICAFEEGDAIFKPNGESQPYYAYRTLH